MLGRPWPAPGEPLFLADDLELFLNWQVELDDACPRCSQPLSESTLEANEGGYKVPSYVCHSCAAIAGERRRVQQHGTAADTLDGRFFFSELIPDE